MFCKNAVSNFPSLFKIECAAAKFSKNKLVIYQFAFCYFFYGAMVTCLKEVFWFLCLV